MGEMTDPSEEIIFQGTVPTIMAKGSFNIKTEMVQTDLKYWGSSEGQF